MTHSFRLLLIFMFAASSCKNQQPAEVEAAFTNVSGSSFEFHIDCQTKENPSRSGIAFTVHKTLKLTTGEKDFFFTHSRQTNEPLESPNTLERFYIPLNQLKVTGTAKRLTLETGKIALLRNFQGMHSSINLKNLRIEFADKKVSIASSDNSYRRSFENCRMEHFKKNN